MVKGAVKALALDSCRLGDLGNAAPPFGNMPAATTSARGSTESSIAALRYSAAKAWLFRNFWAITASWETLVLSFMASAPVILPMFDRTVDVGQASFVAYRFVRTVKLAFEPIVRCPVMIHFRNASKHRR